jgi:isopentenyl diphosphate isomerase/L-lactate dehydrogenase-like FMN-dependent dehydrogenase
MSAEVFDYIDGAAGDELTASANRDDLASLRLLPLCLRDVRRPDTRTRLLGHSVGLPIGIGPTALHQLVHPDGELATARAARTLDVPMVVSSASSVALEDVPRETGNPRLLLQTYIFEDRGVTADLVHRAEANGYTGIVITVGAPVAGKRDRNIRNRFRLPPGIGPGNFATRSTTDLNNPIHSFRQADLDPSATWRDLEWLRGLTALPVVVKGIMNRLDVAPAVDLQISGLVVSNHGGRQLDTAESTVRALPAIVQAAAGRLPVLIDSGFRRGTDILKAIALGADGALLGRPVMWALAVGGETGLVDAIRLLANEFRTAMQLSGCAGIQDIRENAAALLRWRT